jgi:sulfoxide reductase heme-binding subunit YedZ
MLDYSPLGRIPKHIGKIKILVFLFSLIPLFILIIEFHQDDLGIDPLDRLTRLTGKTALVLLILSLVITPLRHFLIVFMVRLKANYGKRLADWNWIIKLRRTIGVMSFFYVLLHFIIYFWLDQGLDLESALYDIKERNFIAIGLTAFILLIPLALTSTNRMMRLLGKKWRKLHRTVYIIALLAIAHFWMLSKVAVYDYVPYVLITFFLLGWRAWYYGVGRKNKLIDDGMEAVDREQINRIINNLSFLAEKTFGGNEGKVMVSILFNILSSEQHYSESILNRNNDLMLEISDGSKSMIKRLKLARKNAKEKISVQSILGLQTGRMPGLLELVDKIDTQLKQGMECYEKNDDNGLSEVWTEVFSLLMPVS